MKLLIRRRQSGRTDPFQIFFIAQPFPDMFISVCHMPVAVCMHGLQIEHFERHILQDLHVGSFLRLVPEHRQYFTPATVIITFPVSSESPVKHISVYIYRFLFTLRTGHMNDHNHAAVFFQKFYVTV